MATGYRIKQDTDDQSVLLESLKQQQKSVKEGSALWYDLEAKINAIIAERFLHLMNR